MATKIAFIKAAVIPNVVGRIDYVSNPERQQGTKEIKEKLLGFYQTPEDPKFWKELAKHSQTQGKYHSKQTVVEAREHIMQISNGIYRVATAKDHAAIAKRIAEEFKKEHGVECAVGIHMNEDGTDYHAHIVFAERVYVPGEPDRAPATRNTYFDADGKRSTKAACVDENGKLKKGCLLVKKGERFPSSKFGAKNQKFADPTFLKAEKERQAKFMSELCREYGVQEEWIRYNHKTNPHMRLYDLKRGEPEALRAWKEFENEKIRAYNKTIDELLATGEITTEQALDIKKQVYEKKAEQREAIRMQRERRMLEYRRKQLEHEYRYESYVAHLYRENGERRGLFELMVILALMIVGLDDKVLGLEGYKNEIDEINEELKRTNSNVIYVKSEPFLQGQIDAFYRAAGRKTPTELIEESALRRQAEMLKQSTKQGNNALADLVGAAEAERSKSLAGRRSEPERRGER